MKTMYLTYLASPTHQQVVFDFEALYNNFGEINQKFENIPSYNVTTRINEQMGLDLFEKYKLNDKIKILEDLAKRGLDLPRDYERFYIPKKTGGLREINAPNIQLANHLRTVKDTFEETFLCKAHDSAYAYVKGRSILDAVKEHQKNGSNWFLKLDIKNFFDNCNEEFIIKQLNQVYPFALMDEQLLRDLITPGLLEDRLPQGTPLSPFLTNMIMVPIDVAIMKFLMEQKTYFIYTRYADDIIISSEFNFDWKAIQDGISDILEELTPFEIKTQKTRYGSRAGRNWNLGLMLNKDNNITVGHKKKERCRAMIYSFMKDYSEGNFWSKHDIQVMLGLFAYYKMVENAYFENIIQKYNKKFNLDFYEITKL